MARCQPQPLPLERPGGPATAGDQPVPTADDLQRQRLGAGRLGPGPARRRLDVDHQVQQGAAHPRQAPDRGLSLRGRGVGGQIQSCGAQGGGHPRKGRGATPVNARQAPIGHHQRLCRGGQFLQSGFQRLGHGLRQLRQRVLEHQEIEQQLQPCFRAARHMGAVGPKRPRQGAGQPLQGAPTQARAGHAGQHTSGDRHGHGPGRRPAGRSRRTQQLARLTGDQHGQLTPLGVGGDGPHAPQGRCQVQQSPGHPLGVPGKGGPAMKHPSPAQRQSERLARPGLAFLHQGGQPVEAVQRLGKAPRRTGPVPWVQRGGHIQTDPGQGKAPLQDGLAGTRGLKRAEIARRGGKGGRLQSPRAALQGLAIAGQTIKLDPDLPGHQPPDYQRPYPHAGSGARRPDRRPGRCPAQAGNLAFGNRALRLGERADPRHQ